MRIFFSAAINIIKQGSERRFMLISLLSRLPLSQAAILLNTQIPPTTTALEEKRKHFIIIVGQSLTLIGQSYT